MQEVVAQRKEIIAVLQKKHDQNSTQSSNVSSKGELGLSNQEIVDIDEVLESLDNYDNNESR